MKKCAYEGEQEKCVNYAHKSAKDWTCLYYREMCRGWFICDQEYPTKPVEETDGKPESNT